MELSPNRAHETDNTIYRSRAPLSELAARVTTCLPRVTHEYLPPGLATALEKVDRRLGSLSKCIVWLIPDACLRIIKYLVDRAGISKFVRETGTHGEAGQTVAQI